MGGGWKGPAGEGDEVRKEGRRKGRGKESEEGRRGRKGRLEIESQQSGWEV